MTSSLIDKPRTIAAASLMSAAGAAVFLLLPMLVGAAINGLGYSESQAGLLASSYFAGYMLTAISAFFWIRKIAWRLIALLGYIGLSAGLACSATVIDFNLMIPTLFVSGCGAGALFGLGVTMVSDSSNPDRNFGFVLVTQQATAAILLFTLPATVLATWGFAGLTMSLAVILGALGFSIVWIPANNTDSSTREYSEKATLSLTKLWLALTALAVYFAALSGVWAYIERLGDANNLLTTEIGTALAIAMIGGVLGGLAAVFSGDRWGRNLPLLSSTCLFAAIFFVFDSSFGLIEFTLASFLFSAAWNYVLAYQMSVIAQLDSDGRFSVLMPAAQALGAILGPAGAGLLINGGNFSPLLWVATLCIMVAIVPFVMLQSAYSKA